MRMRILAVLLVATAGALTTGAFAAGTDVPKMLAEQGCTGCHADKTKVVGPAWGWVAYHYKDTAKQKAVADVAAFIISGGTGYWKKWTGGIPMPAHSNLSRNQADAIASWILSQPPIAPPKPGA
ncbi:MAG TPA: c-type cytochrome [Gammaproteobacteria bacterium]|nr:c-type cytochrome [Gammaproteobacteria bacterium]